VDVGESKCGGGREDRGLRGRMGWWWEWGRGWGSGFAWVVFGLVVFALVVVALLEGVGLGYREVVHIFGLVELGDVLLYRVWGVVWTKITEALKRRTEC
jgi:hypothetical protein